MNILVADTKGWAFWWMAKGIQKYSSAECSVMTNEEYARLTKKGCRFSDIEAVFHMGLSEAPTRRPADHVRIATLIDHAGWAYSYSDSYLNSRLATKIRNSSALEKARVFDSVLCKNRFLYQYSKKHGFNAYYVTAAVDDAIYCQKDSENKGAVRIGWCGQVGSRMNQKGYNEILVPLVIKTGEMAIEPRFYVVKNSASNAKTQDEMVSWYRSLDLFLCTSCAEGGPMPVLESLSCGVPVLSTNVGFVTELREQCRHVTTVPAWASEDDEPVTVDRLFDVISQFERCENVSVPDGWTWKTQADRWIDAILGR